MLRHPIAALLKVLWASAAFLFTASLVGIAAAVAASAVLLGFVVHRLAGLIFHLSLAAIKILGSVGLGTLILTSAFLGAVRARQA